MQPGKLVQLRPLSMRRAKLSIPIFHVRTDCFHYILSLSHHFIAEYISQAPWYLDTGAPSLSHQRRPTDDRSSNKLDQWYDRNVTAEPAAKKYRKGACENCS